VGWLASAVAGALQRGHSALGSTMHSPQRPGNGRSARCVRRLAGQTLLAELLPVRGSQECHRRNLSVVGCDLHEPTHLDVGELGKPLSQ
jgi:hypothetical protein